MTETAIYYSLVELDRKLKALEFFSKEQAISLGAAKKTSELHKEIIELVSSLTTDKLSVEKLQEQLNTAKKALTEIEAAVVEFADDGDYNFNFAGNLASEALAAIEYEGSGDE